MATHIYLHACLPRSRSRSNNNTYKLSCRLPIYGPSELFGTLKPFPDAVGEYSIFPNISNHAAFRPPMKTK